MHLGVIGGSGLYQLEGMEAAENLELETPYGRPSGPIVRWKGETNTLFFLPRHGLGHTLLPSEVNYRANLFALKSLGVRSLVSISAVGSLQGSIAPGEFVLPNQYIDRTSGRRERTYFGRGIVGHAPFADPACAQLRAHVGQGLKAVGATCHPGGTYVCMEGPQFSTRAESHWYRSWSRNEGPVAVIGMTALPEAYLARELGLCYQTVAMATDYDCWNEEKGDLDVAEILRTISANVALSQKLVRWLSSQRFPTCQSGCAGWMKTAILTPRERWPKERLKEMEVLLEP